MRPKYLDSPAVAVKSLGLVAGIAFASYAFGALLMVALGGVGYWWSRR